MQYKRFLKICFHKFFLQFFYPSLYLPSRLLISFSNLTSKTMVQEKKLICFCNMSDAALSLKNLFNTFRHSPIKLILIYVICISRTINSSAFFKSYCVCIKVQIKLIYLPNPLSCPFFLGNYLFFLYLQFDLYLLKIIKRNLFQYSSPNFGCIFKFFDFFDSFYFSSEVICSKCNC